MKNKRVLLLLPLMLFSALSLKAETAPAPPQRSLFVSVIQDPPVLSNREAIQNLILFSKQSGIQTLFVQVYRANKAWFSSTIADSSPYQDSFKKVGEDPFALLIRQAHEAGIEVHAWMNLLSLSANENAPILKKYGWDILTRNIHEKKTLQDYKIDSQYFLEPGDLRVRAELETLVGEVIQTYPALDGIQLDYIRYPDSHPFYGYTQRNMERFKKALGKNEIREEDTDWKNWKRAQVTGLLETLVKKAHALKPGIQVSTTGCAPYSRAYHEAFQDWASWLDRGLIDFVTMMSYPSETAAFEKQIQGAKAKTGHFDKVNIAVGAYKLLKNPQIFEEELRSCEKAGGRGCAVFHYENLLENKSLAQSLR